MNECTNEVKSFVRTHAVQCNAYVDCHDYTRVILPATAVLPRPVLVVLSKMINKRVNNTKTRGRESQRRSRCLQGETYQMSGTREQKGNSRRYLDLL